MASEVYPTSQTVTTRFSRAPQPTPAIPPNLVNLGVGAAVAYGIYKYVLSRRQQTNTRGTASQQTGTGGVAVPQQVVPPASTQLGTPTNLQQLGGTAHSVIVECDPVLGAIRYDWYEATTGLRVASSPTNVAVIEGLQSNTYYMFYVVAVGYGGAQSPPSQPLLVKTGLGAPVVSVTEVNETTQQQPTQQQPVSPATITLLANPQMTVGTTQTISGVVYGSNGQPLSGAVVNLTATGGMIQSTVSTNASGAFQVSYTAPQSPMLVTISATSGQASGSVQITVVAASQPTVGTIPQPYQTQPTPQATSAFTVTGAYLASTPTYGQPLRIYVTVQNVGSVAAGTTVYGHIDVGGQTVGNLSPENTGIIPPGGTATILMTSAGDLQFWQGLANAGYVEQVYVYPKSGSVPGTPTLTFTMPPFTSQGSSSATASSPTTQQVFTPTATLASTSVTPSSSASSTITATTNSVSPSSAQPQQQSGSGSSNTGANVVARLRQLDTAFILYQRAHPGANLYNNPYLRKLHQQANALRAANPSLGLPSQGFTPQQLGISQLIV